MPDKQFQLVCQAAHFGNIGQCHLCSFAIARRDELGIELDVFLREVDPKQADQLAHLEGDRQRVCRAAIIVDHAEQSFGHAHRCVMLVA